MGIPWGPRRVSFDCAWCMRGGAARGMAVVVGVIVLFEVEGGGGGACGEKGRERWWW